FRTWRKFSNSVRQTIFHRLIPRQKYVMVLEFSPKIGRKVYMRPNNYFDSFIIQNQTLGNILQLAGGSKLGTISTTVQHECGGLGGLSIFSPQISDDPSRRDLTDIVESHFNGYGAQEIVEEHSVSRITPSRLEEKMNMFDVRAHCNR